MTGKGKRGHQVTWDARAAQFDRPIADDGDPYVALVNREAPLDGAEVADIGCGTGRYGLAFCDRAFRLIGVDSSSEMIRLARIKADDAGIGNAEFVCAEWDEFPESDVVLSHMVPPVCGGEQALHISSKCRKAGFIAHYLRRNSPVWEMIYRVGGTDGREEEGRIPAILDALEDAGLSPRIEKWVERRRSEKTIEQARTLYIDGAMSFLDLSDEQVSEIDGWLTERTSDGIFVDASEPEIGCVWWCR